MKRLICTAILALFAATTLNAQDPSKTDGDKYKVILENDRVRVLDYKDKPGDKTSMHSHPDHIIYVLGAFERKFTFPDSTTRVISGKAGDIIEGPAHTHMGENIGKTDTHVLIIEMKTPAIAKPADTTAAPK